MSRSADLKARRQRIQDRLLARAEKMLDRLDADTWPTLVKDEGGAERTQQLTFVPVRDERDAAWTIGAYLANEERLEKVNGDSTETDARSMLTGLMRDVQGAWAMAQKEAAQEAAP